MDRFEKMFTQYEVLAGAADRIFEKVKQEFSKEMTCNKGCSDCCHALFDVSLVEALYLNHHFNNRFAGEDRETLIEKANRADRTIYKIKRDARKRLEKGHTEEDLLVSLAAERVRCPLLNSQNQCDLYEYRPITCRLYGVPTEIGGLTHSCGLSGFIKGKSYPTVHMEKMNYQLFSLATAYVQEISSRYNELSGLVMPVSAALLTEFDEAFLGIGDADTTNIDSKNKEAGE
jgi:Fe-S-cluster containining protein